MPFLLLFYCSVLWRTVSEYRFCQRSPEPNVNKNFQIVLARIILSPWLALPRSWRTVSYHNRGRHIISCTSTTQHLPAGHPSRPGGHQPSMSYKWNHTLGMVLRLASLLKLTFVRIVPVAVWSCYWTFKFRIAFHCRNIPPFIYPFCCYVSIGPLQFGTYVSFLLLL